MELYEPWFVQVTVAVQVVESTLQSIPLGAAGAAGGSHWTMHWEGSPPMPAAMGTT